MIDKIGEFSPEVVALLNLDILAGTEILIGVTNIAHMAKEHPYEFNRYFDRIPLILSTPDYVRIKQDDCSIEYVKRFSRFVKVAVRIAGDGKYYARSLYRVRDSVVARLIKNKKLKSLTKL